MKLIFLHIPKCAGTSIRMGFETLLGEHRVYWLGHNNDEQDFFDGHNAEFLEALPVVGGHFTIEHTRSFSQGAIFSSIVREPVARVVSMFNFLTVGNPDHPLSRELIGLSLRDALTRSERFRWEATNMQCQYIGGFGAGFNAAMHSIVKEKWIIGTTPKRVFSELCAVFGMQDIDLPRANEGIARPIREIDSADLEYIMELNADDVRLFEFLSSIE